jgi:hypothetical protein
MELFTERMKQAMHAIPRGGFEVGVQRSECSGNGILEGERKEPRLNRRRRSRNGAEMPGNRQVSTSMQLETVKPLMAEQLNARVFTPFRD